jgi:hypothetical protein
MINANEHLKTSIARVEQLKNQKKSKERREQEKRRKMEARRHFELGRVADKYFPDIEPATFENLLRVLVNNTELLARLEEEAATLM